VIAGGEMPPLRNGDILSPKKSGGKMPPLRNGDILSPK
jgi:hypothetical protein